MHSQKIIELENKGFKLAYDIVGAEKPTRQIIIVHGLMSSGYSGELIDKQLENLGIQAFLPNRPGTSYSTSHEFSFQSFSQDIVAMAKKENLPSVDLISISAATPFTLAAAAKLIDYNIPVDSLSILSGISDINHPGIFEGASAWSEIFLRSGFAARLFLHFINHFPSLGTESSSDPVRQKITDILLDRRTAFLQGPDHIAYERDLLAKRWSEDLYKLAIPILILHAKDDEICTFKMAKRNHGRLKTSKLVPFTGGHFFYLDQLEGVLNEIDSFKKLKRI